MQPLAHIRTRATDIVHTNLRPKNATLKSKATRQAPHLDHPKPDALNPNPKPRAQNGLQAAERSLTEVEKDMRAVGNKLFAQQIPLDPLVPFPPPLRVCSKMCFQLR